MSFAGVRCTPDGWNERVERTSRGIDGVGMLAVEADATVEAMSAVVAAITAGIPVVPVSADAGPREREHILADSGADALWSHGTLHSVGRGVPASPTSGELVLYTSGTTGSPKGVPITLAAVEACVDALAEAWEWTPDDTLVHGLPLHHVHGLVLGLLGPLLVGSAVAHTGRPTPQAYAAEPGTLYFGVPTVWSRIVGSPEAARRLRTARLLVSGSAALPRAVFESLGELCGRAPVERYGMTETLITVSARAGEPRVQGTVGHPISGVRTRLVDDQGTVVAHNATAIGELQVRGPGIFAGYLRRPDETRAAFTDDGWFRTGDVATIDEDGAHRLIGRASTDLIKSGGYRIGAGEVEDALLSHPGVTEAAVIGVPDDDLGQRLVAFVVASGCTADELVEFVGTQVSWHKRPREVRFVDALPRNAMGKVEKARLP